MNKALVDKKIIEYAKIMAYDLYGLAYMNGYKEIKKQMKAFMKKADKYLDRLDSNK